MSRNQPCACGSGKRYKDCHGRIEFIAPSRLYRQALAAHQSGQLRHAESLYREAIAANPRDVDSLHMLGVALFERRHYHEALHLLWDAAERTGWNDVVLRQNLGLLLAKLLTPEANARQEEYVAAFQARRREIERSSAVRARVSVVLTVGKDARTVARAIDSVVAQTYADIDLIVVDHGASDACATTIGDSLSRTSLPATVLRSAQRGASHAANQGARAARGRYLAFLEADDWFAPDRVEAMVGAAARDVPLWACSHVAYRTDDDRASPHDEPVRPRHALVHDSASFMLQSRNVPERAGNLFIDRELFLQLGGYRDSEADRGWDFALRAARAVEPVVVPRELYGHGGRAPDRSAAGGSGFQGALERGAAELPASIWTSDFAAANPFSPEHRANRVLLLRSELRAGRGDRLPVALLRTIAAQWRERAAAPAHVVAPSANAEKVAVVVLGMYRSGTSAIARVLNLCGAFLPERVIAARLGINPKGFWETEAVTDIDARLLELLGGDWNRVGFTLPSEGPLVDEFLLNAREVLATEYGNAATILIKDPRICVLAPLWHRALREAGYRPAYIVVVRNPLEVAGSIETQGDMPLAQGLDLWREYMGRVERFIESVDARVVHVRYAELLEDWRSVVERVARGLDVALHAAMAAPDVDAFLEAGLRNHRANDAELAGIADERVRALYRRQLDRAGTAQRTSGSDSATS